MEPPTSLDTRGLDEATDGPRISPAGSVTLVPIYLAGLDHLLPTLRQVLERAFGIPTRQHLPGFDPEATLEPARGQYNSRALLALLLREPAPPGTRVLGVCGIDLFIPVLTYVFGEAQFEGSAAIVSAHRLRSEMYGLPADPGLLAERLQKEAIHELGHTFGLVHCVHSDCVMHSSTYVEEIDLKSASLCSRCHARCRSFQARDPRTHATR
ncbi:MAG: peptidase M54 [Candidatus Riflebacteria bacterium]|nr:peptidase M54 [Candidatus Riflebacteria bacterium]